MTTPTGFDAARQVADAVLYEGYLLYPYHAGATKNQLRWQFGVLVPPAAADATGEHSTCRTECLLEHLPGPDTGLTDSGAPGSPRWAAALGSVHVRTRFLRLVDRTVWVETPRGLVPTDVVHTAAGDLRAGQEATPREEDTLASLGDLLGHRPTDSAGCVSRAPAVWTVPLAAPAGRDVEPADAQPGIGGPTGRVVREWQRVDAELRLSARWLPGPYRVIRLTAQLCNVSPWSPSDAAGQRPPADRAATRNEALRRSLLAAHLVLAAPGWRFLSLVDPPAWAATYAAGCRNDRAWPALVDGGVGCGDTVLSAPIILPDHPTVAPESAGVFFDATEIDELLALRTRTLTDEEKALARATDPRADELLERAEHLPDELLERLHGAIRDVRPAAPPPPPSAPPGARPRQRDGERASPAGAGTSWWDNQAGLDERPEAGEVLVRGTRVAAGSAVRLAPAGIARDAQDMFLAGRTATVAAVLRDVDGATHIAVTLDDDPAADLAGAVGRFRYFRPDEIIPLGPPGPGEAPS